MPYTVLLCLLVVDQVASQTVFPTQYSYPTNGSLRSANGSHIVGYCSDSRGDSSVSVCSQPLSSVLFDGNIPTLTGLDGDMWASQLLTLHRLSSSNFREITSEFTGTPGYDGVGGVQLVIFNCPEWGISVESVQLLEQQGSFQVHAGNISNLETSCNSLVTVSLCLEQRSMSSQVTLEFDLDTNSDWIHVAELTFFSHAELLPCTFSTTKTNPEPSAMTLPTKYEVCPSCSTSTALASVITAIATALLATVIFVLVQIAVCKCHPKFTPERGTSAGGEGQEYEEVDGGEGGIPLGDYAYMYVNDASSRGNDFHLWKNEAYGEGNPFKLTSNEAYTSTH